MSAENLVGETLISVDDCGDQILLRTASGREFVIQHRQDCCEYVSILDQKGEWHKLYGKVLTGVYHDENSNPDKVDGIDYYESATLTTITFTANEDTVISRWFGESNGYYSETVDIDEITR